MSDIVGPLVTKYHHIIHVGLNIVKITQHIVCKPLESSNCVS